MMDKKNMLVTVGVVAVIAVAGFVTVAMGKEDDSMANMPDQSDNSSMMMKDDNASSKQIETDANGVAVGDKVTIDYKGFAVVQKTIKIKKGTTVTWYNNDNAKHDVTPVNESADFKATELFGKGESKSITFNTVGKYSYFCSPHPYMKGMIEVVE